MKKLPVFLSLLASTLVFASCEKEIEEMKDPAQEVAAAAATVQSKPELLAAGPWHLTSLTLSTAAQGAAATPAVDILPRLKDAQRDNQHTFKADGGYVLDEAALKAYPEAPQQTTGTWKLNGDSLTVSQPNVTRHFFVEELNTTTLRVKLAQDGSTYTSVFSR
ncbi:lipocalin-like domain-containing protein [Hymenobacter metallilatus]|nr:lipocalin family protein [Hymenobacter metallilatus]